MRVTLGYAWEGHEPDTTLELPNAIARALLHNGRARRADDEVEAERDAAEKAAVAPADEPVVFEPQLEDLKNGELRELAAWLGVEIPETVGTRKELIATLREAPTSEPPTEEPVTGTNTEEAPHGR